MVDFKQRLGASPGKKPLDPMEIYDSLDRASDKGPLRPAQEAVLKDWHANRRELRDVIVKLHTGQGKTIIGLIILQSKLNEKVGPALYLCPDTFLVEQTAKQGRQFGFDCCVVGGSDDLPTEFFDSKSILITTASKLFNGLTKFGLRAQSKKVGALVLDDVHACIDVIRDASAIRLSPDSQAYAELVNLFGPALESQGQGTFADLVNGKYDAMLPVPYWDWIDRSGEVASILAKYSDNKQVKFAWPLIRDILPECECLVSGASLEILPRLPPVGEFQSWERARHRVYMSATVSDDSFLVRGLGLQAETIKNPLTFSGEKWSGEKMVLIPSLVDQSLTRGSIVERFARPATERKHGVVVLVPSFKRSKDWEAYGSRVATRESIDDEIERLRVGKCEAPLVIANRYDGLDLPDSTCRVLILDSRPRGESLNDRYQESCLADTEVIAAKIARIVEQGMGRSVRGEKDYSVILVIGSDLVSFVRSSDSRAFLSAQTRQQVEIGLGIADLAKEEIQKGDTPMRALIGLVNQCLKRDSGWKEYYIKEMGGVSDPSAPPKRLEVFALELKGETLAKECRFEEAAAASQAIADKHARSDAEKGWFLQESARHLYRASKIDSETLQTVAHRKNRFLLRPRTRTGTTVRLKVEQRRVEKIVEWIGTHDDGAALALAVDTLLADLHFGVESDTFEAAFDALGKILGFASERPDREWKEGPDNLWALRDALCLVVECKSEVKLERSEIEKRESDQMNRSAAWFGKTYPGVKGQFVMIIPPKKLATSAALLQATNVLQRKGLERLADNVRKFFAEFRNQDLRSLSPGNIQNALDLHELSIEHLLGAYTVPVKGAGIPLH